MWAFDAPNNGVKRERDNDPKNAASRCSGHAQCAAAQMKREEVDANGNQHPNVKGDPKPDARRHWGQVFMPKAVGQTQIARRADATYTSHNAFVPINGR